MGGNRPMLDGDSHWPQMSRCVKIRHGEIYGGSDFAIQDKEVVRNAPTPEQAVQIDTEIANKTECGAERSAGREVQRRGLSDSQSQRLWLTREREAQVYVIRQSAGAGVVMQ